MRTQSSPRESTRRGSLAATEAKQSTIQTTLHIEEVVAQPLSQPRGTAARPATSAETLAAAYALENAEDESPLARSLWRLRASASNA